MSRYYLTTSIPYPSGEPHVGHSFEMITADAMARYRRLRGQDVFFLGGLDENSQRVSRSARQEGIDTQTYVDQAATRYTTAWDLVGVEFDDFVRTTEPRHLQTVQAFYNRVFDNGDIYKGRYEGWYCVRCEAFYTDEELVENCCPTHRVPPEWVEEDNYFFALSRYQERLLELYEQRPDFVWPESRRNEMLGFLRQGLKDFSISRAGGKWGLPLPNDPDHVIYVWFDALINYITGIGFGQTGGNDLFEKRWPADAHVVGKDIVRFHAIYWPAMLMAAGVEVPRQVCVHGWVSFAGEELSQSGGHVVRPREVVERFGSDALRYFLLREIAYERDGDFTWEGMARRYQHDLGNDLGNLVLRSTSMLHRYLDGVAPELSDLTGRESELRAAEQTAWELAAHHFEGWRFHLALAAVWRYITAVNQYIERTEPWRLARDEAQRSRLNTVLAMLMDALPRIATMIRPAMPATADAIEAQLGVTDRPAVWAGDASAIEAGQRVPGGPPLFPRLDG